MMCKNTFNLDGLNSDLTEQEFLKWNYNVWEMDTEPNRNHPAHFPEELPTRLIKIFSYPEQIVLDPFSTILVPCFFAYTSNNLFLAS